MYFRLCITSGLFAQSLLGTIFCCILFGVGMGRVAAFMNEIFAESLGIEIIQVGTGLRGLLLFLLLLGHNWADVSFYRYLDASNTAYNWAS